MPPCQGKESQGCTDLRRKKPSHHQSAQSQAFYPQKTSVWYVHVTDLDILVDPSPFSQATELHGHDKSKGQQSQRRLNACLTSLGVSSSELTWRCSSCCGALLTHASHPRIKNQTQKTHHQQNASNDDPIFVPEAVLGWLLWVST